MIVFLTVAVAITAVVALFDLSITLAILRRLRHVPVRGENSELTSVGIKASGEQLEFRSLEDTDPNVRRILGGDRESLFAFFSDSCSECIVQAPALVELASRSEREVVAVVTGPSAQTFADERLMGLSIVIAEELDGPLHQGFGVWGFPAFCTVKDYRIVDSGHALQHGDIIAAG